MGIPSLLRLEEHKALSDIVLSGRVLDLGGDKNSGYLHLFKGQFETTTLNLDEKALPDIVHNLEKSLPVNDDSYNHVLLINVLEHVFDYRTLLRESVRVLQPNGSLIILVPFLFPIHPSPEDYHRFSASALRKELALAGLKEMSVRTLGHGVFSVRYLLLDRLLPKPIRLINFYTCRYIAYGFDWCAQTAARLLGKKYNREDYALGFVAVAHK